MCGATRLGASFLQEQRVMDIMRSFTPQERAILQLLDDGQPHSKAEIKRVCDDDLMLDSSVYNHIKNMRQKLRLIGQDIIGERGSLEHTKYRLVRTTASHSRG